jgi:hypothetical protein
VVRKNKSRRSDIVVEIGTYVEVYPSETYHNDPTLRGIVVGYGHNHPNSQEVVVKLDKYPGVFAYTFRQIKILSDKKND